ncbi:MAG: hypothetical protein J6T23_06930 [Elusimicrobia bacterium]|nr:hypothetical protein [Elusimicrobiota bacterium]
MSEYSIMDFIKFMLTAFENHFIDILLSAVVSLFMISIGIFCGWIKFQLNLKKPLFLFEFDSDNLKRVEEVLKDRKFKISNRSKDLTSLDDFKKKHSILIVGYSNNNSAKLEKAVNRAMLLKLPIIIFCNSNCRISDNDMNIILSYTYYEICTNPLRLILTIRNICQNY